MVLSITVKPVYSGHLETQQNCPYYRGVLISGVHLYGSGTTVNCPYYRGVLISECSQYSTSHRQCQNETHLNAFGGKLKRVCIHHTQVMVGTVERSKHDFY